MQLLCLRLAAQAVAVLTVVAACQNTRQGGPSMRDAARPLQPLTPVELVAEMERLVRAQVRSPESAGALLDRLDEIKGRLRMGDNRGARPVIFSFIETVEDLVARGDLSPENANALFLYAGNTLADIAVQPLCKVTPGPAGRAPYRLYVSSTCVARLESNPADPETPLAPDAREHCRPVTAALQLDLINQALATCRADAYTCAPAAPGICPTGCTKDVRPGYSVPTVSFIPNSRRCQAEPIRKHLCEAFGAYECICSCTSPESS